MTQLVFCKVCRKQISGADEVCPHCGGVPGQSSSDDSLKYILPVGRSGWAITAGYMALFSILVLPAPFALFCGLMAVRDINKNPHKIGMPRAIFGIVVGGLITLTFLVLMIRR